jgi:NAD(P)-dependent dehydrogenase (short-subunit alcohol dehydrogenase family)
MSQYSKHFDLTGKVALVTGGASGLGKGIAQAFVESGAKVLVGSRTLDKVQGAVEEISAVVGAPVGEAIAGVALDVTKDESVNHAVKKALDLFGRLDILVNSAGSTIRKPTFEIPPADFTSIYETHVTGSLRCAQAAGRIFREQHSGAIINLASVSSFVDLIEVAAYASAKNAIIGLTKSLANEWAKHGIRTNAIAPGFIPTDLNRKMIEGTERGRRIMEHTPMARFGKPDEIASGAVYLASPAASFVNGTILVIDGGYLSSGIGDSVAPWAV